VETPVFEDRQRDFRILQHFDHVAERRAIPMAWSPLPDLPDLVVAKRQYLRGDGRQEGWVLIQLTYDVCFILQ
jgi:hypothetical protein